MSGLDLHNTLTAAGIKFCAAVLGVSHPTYEACHDWMWCTSPACDLFLQCPTLDQSSPDIYRDMDDFKKFDGCVAWATYKIADGASGTETFCWRSGYLRFYPDSGIWRWSFDAKN